MMQHRKHFSQFVFCGLVSTWLVSGVAADPRGDELAKWMNARGQEVWGAAPQKCDDLTFARRVYLDLLGRVPSVSELRDYEQSQSERRSRLIEDLVFGEGERAESNARLAPEQMARQWRQVLLPAGTATDGPTDGLEAWLRGQFANDTPFDDMMRKLIRVQDSETPAVVAAGVATGSMNYYQLLGGLPENYAGNLSRVMLGVRIECTQCHDHPFSSWKQPDFWGLAAFFGDLRSAPATDSTPSAELGRIRYENKTYQAKLLWSAEPLNTGSSASSQSLRARLGEWMTSKNNPNFAATAVNRFWQHLVGRGLYAEVENLDWAKPEERRFADELGEKFAADGYRVRSLIAAICKSDWYQSVSQDITADPNQFYRPMKCGSPEQVFNSLEQALHLPISRINPNSPRWSGDRMQLVSRLSESSGRTPEDYSAGIPQALLLMNGRLTSDAVNPETGRLLRAITDSPFLQTGDRVETLFMAVLTRRPTSEESAAIEQLLESKSDDAARQRVMSELLWALLNSPEFVLCR